MSVTIPFEAAFPAAAGSTFNRANGSRTNGSRTNGTNGSNGSSGSLYAAPTTFADTWTSMIPRARRKRADTWTKTIQLPADARAASAARDHIRRCVRAWNAANAATRLANSRTERHLPAREPICEDATETAVLLTSELVTNALTHGESPVTVAVSWSGEQLRVEVHDRSRYLPTPWPVHMAPDDETGRGLLLVDTLATDWGFYRTPGGKAVYFTLNAE
jgi:anti-sigma regulatory factor (Ser/Thr protein kinase)